MKPTAASVCSFIPAKPPALGVEELRRHSCKLAFCPQCHAARSLALGVFSRRLPLDPENLKGDTWVSFHCPEAGKFSIGCTLCSTGKFGRGEVSSFNGCRVVNLLKHQDSVVHRQAVARAFGRGEIAPSKLAPKVEDFRSVLGDKSKGTANRHGVEGVGGRKKVAKLKFCVKEAFMNAQRKFMAQCRSISIHQDVAGKRLLIKFVAATPSLEYSYGVLGACHVLDSDRGADGIALATKKTIQSFCTPLDGLNYDFVVPRKRESIEKSHGVCVELENHICQCIEMYDTDAARDEMVAGRLLSTSNIVDGLDGYLPNVLIYKKDSTHAVKRLGGC